MDIATQQPVDVTPVVTADPELCWLVGSVAYSSGQGDKLKTVLGSTAADTPCTTDALRGAAGVNR